MYICISGEKLSKISQGQCIFGESKIPKYPSDVLIKLGRPANTPLLKVLVHCWGLVRMKLSFPKQIILHGINVIG